VSRWLVTLCAIAFATLCLAPVAVMALRVESADVGALFEMRVWSLLWRTLKLGLAVAFGCLALGVPFGFLVARTDVLGARFLRPLAIVPLLVPARRKRRGRSADSAPFCAPTSARCSRARSPAPASRSPSP